MKPIISIIVPAYNLERYLQKCLDSVVNQTFTGYEVIIIDDGSTDNTPKIASSYLKDPRFKLIRQDNKGVSSARNLGLSLAQGKYVVFLDGDDYWDTQFLQKSMSILEDTKSDVCYSGFRVVNEHGNILRVHKNPLVHNPLLSFLKGDIWIQISGVVIRKKILQKYNIKFREGCHHGQDIEFLYKVLSVSKVSSTGEVLYSYLRRQNSLSSGFKLKHLHTYGAHIRALRFIENNMRKNETKEKILREFQNRRIPLLLLNKVYQAAKYGNRRLAIKLLTKSPVVRYWISKFSPNTPKDITLSFLYLTGVVVPHIAEIIENVYYSLHSPHLKDF